MSGYSLLLLDPQTDRDLYIEAYNWRQPKRHVQPDRMPLEVFASDDPSHLTIGLFNGELCAVYFLHETEPSIYQAHFTSRRGVPRVPILEGARQTARLLLDNGATQIDAWVTERNRALRIFLSDLGFKCVQSDTDGYSIPADATSVGKQFVKYVLRG